jgi:hypothetical protein
MVVTEKATVPGTGRRKRHAHRQQTSNVWWLCARLSVVAAAVTSVAVGAGPIVRAPLTLAACVAVFEAIARQRGESGLVRLLVVSGSILVSLVLIGLVLDVAPGGISRLGWAVAFGLLAVCALAGAGRSAWRPARVTLRPRMRRQGTWYATSLIVAALAIVVSLNAAHEHVQVPPLQFFVQSRAPSAATVEASSGDLTGPLEIVEGPAFGGTVLAGPVRVSPGRPLVIRVPTPGGRVLQLRLVTAGRGRGMTSIRELELEGS